MGVHGSHHGGDGRLGAVTSWRMSDVSTEEDYRLTEHRRSEINRKFSFYSTQIYNYN